MMMVADDGGGGRRLVAHALDDELSPKANNKPPR
jgi:hypothetical protein